MHVTFDSLKTFYNIFVQKLKNHRGNWNQNDPTTDDYIKNRPFYSEVSIVTLVDNLTAEDYNNGNAPSCNFVPEQSYNVTWNGVLYENLVCYYDEYNIVASDKNGCPFYIDDGGNGLYIESEEENWTVSISTAQETVHQIDSKYVPIPEGIVTEDDLSQVAFTGNYNDLLDTPPLATVATSGSYNDLSDKPADLLRYSAQTLTYAEQQRARANISAPLDHEVVKHVAQTLSATQQKQVRDNIGSPSADDVYVKDEIYSTEPKTFFKLWDGNIEGISDSFEVGSTSYYKISDEIIPYNTVTSFIAVTYQGASAVSLNLAGTSGNYMTTSSDGVPLAFMITSTEECTIKIASYPYTFTPPSTGLYARKGSSVYTERVTIEYNKEKVGLHLNSIDNDYIINVDNDGILSTKNIDDNSIVTFATQEQLNTLVGDTSVADQIAAAVEEKVQADWDETDTTSPAYIKNKPVISGDGSTSVQSDWNQTDETQADFIKNKPITWHVSRIIDLAKVGETGEYLDLKHRPFGEIDFLEEQTWAFEKDTEDEIIYYYHKIYNNFSLVEGEQYKVTWDGTEYTRICKRYGDSTLLYIGNFSLLTDILENTGEPFVVVEQSIITYDSSDSHTFSVIPINAIKKIDSKYLPDTDSSLPEITAADDGKVLGVVDGSPKWIEQSGSGSGSESNDLPSDFFVPEEKLTDVLPKEDLDFTYNSTFGAYTALAFYNEEVYQEWESYNGMVRVVWDNVEYDVPMQHVDALSGVGDCTGFGGTGNNEPFIIGIIKEANDSVEGGYDYIMVIMSKTTEASHNVQISYIGEEQNINKEYLPELPVFDFAAMGLPALALDGEIVSVECDTSELYEALGKGSVKISFLANVGIEITASGIVSAMFFDDTYQCCFIGEFGTSIIVLSFTVTKTHLRGRCNPIASLA